MDLFFVLKFHDDHDFFVVMHMFVSLHINAKFEGCLLSISRTCKFALNTMNFGQRIKTWFWQNIWQITYRNIHVQAFVKELVSVRDCIRYPKPYLCFILAQCWVSRTWTQLLLLLFIKKKPIPYCNVPSYFHLTLPR